MAKTPEFCVYSIVPLDNNTRRSVQISAPKEPRHQYTVLVFIDDKTTQKGTFLRQTGRICVTKNSSIYCKRINEKEKEKRKNCQA
jgi:hypothetical protein